MVLDKIVKENDIKRLNEEELNKLAKEIRRFLVKKISLTGGHLASNLGVVELTMALHLSLDLPKDKIIWDVGHQSYTHKLLTGRREGFDELRKYGGMSGFPKRKESPCDSFDTGHSSTSISAGLGYVVGSEIQKENYRVVSVIGDGSLTGGMAYEALNNASALKKNFIIILNDNNMSISSNVGGMSKYLDGIRTNLTYHEIKNNVERTLMSIPKYGKTVVDKVRKTKNGIKQWFVPGMFFEDMGITYLGPVNGHDLPSMIRVLEEAKNVKGSVLVHVLTTKGKGYKPAEQKPDKFHGTGPFEVKTGNKKETTAKKSYTDIFGETLCKVAKNDSRIVAITAAMEDGTGLSQFKKEYPKRFFDVGIAEEHAVTFAAGLAASGLHPVVTLYSSFLQRAYDQVIHDVCLQNLPVVFAIDRAGLVGSDGETHQGIFDVSFLSNIPNLTILAPKNGWELEQMLEFAFSYEGPIVIRYPRGDAYVGLKEFVAPITYGRSEILYEEEQIALLPLGHMMEAGVGVRNRLKDIGYECSLMNPRFVKPIDLEMLKLIEKDHELLVVIEENLLAGGLGSNIQMMVEKNNLNLHVMELGIEDDYIEHGSIKELRREVLLDEESIVKQIVTKYISITGNGYKEKIEVI